MESIAARGEADVFVRLVERHLGPAYRLARAILLADQEAEDAVQAPTPAGATWTIADLEAGGLPFVAVGWLGVAPDSARAVVWESAGGSRWESVPYLPLFENAAPVGVVRTGSGTLVVLSQERAPDANATQLWLATPASSPAVP